MHKWFKRHFQHSFNISLLRLPAVKKQTDKPSVSSFPSGARRWDKYPTNQSSQTHYSSFNHFQSALSCSLINSSTRSGEVWTTHSKRRKHTHLVNEDEVDAIKAVHFSSVVKVDFLRSGEVKIGRVVLESSVWLRYMTAYSKQNCGMNGEIV